MCKNARVLVICPSLKLSAGGSPEEHLSDGPALSLRGTGDEDWVSNDLINQPTPGGRTLHRSHLRGQTRLGSRRCRSRQGRGPEPASTEYPV